MRVVLDTNVIVAGMAYPARPPDRIMAAWHKGALDVVLSPWILSECERVLPRLGPFQTLSTDGIRDLIEGLAFIADIVRPDLLSLSDAAAAGVRDVADEPVLPALLASGAEVLVSGDKDLLALAGCYLILTSAEFCARHAP